MPSPTLQPVELSDEERSVLTGWARRRKTAQAQAQAQALRSRIVLRCAEDVRSVRWPRPSGFTGWIQLVVATP